MGRSQSIRPTKQRDLLRRYQDLLEIARLVSWYMNKNIEDVIVTKYQHSGLVQTHKNHFKGDEKQ